MNIIIVKVFYFVALRSTLSSLLSILGIDEGNITGDTGPKMGQGVFRH